MEQPEPIKPSIRRGCPNRLSKHKCHLCSDHEVGKDKHTGFTSNLRQAEKSAAERLSAFFHVGVKMNFLKTSEHVSSSLNCWWISHCPWLLLLGWRANCQQLNCVFYLFAKKQTNNLTVMQPHLHLVFSGSFFQTPVCLQWSDNLRLFGPLTFPALRFVVVRGCLRGQMNMYAAASSEKLHGSQTGWQLMTSMRTECLDWRQRGVRWGFLNPTLCLRSHFPFFKLYQSTDCWCV